MQCITGQKNRVLAITARDLRRARNIRQAGVLDGKISMARWAYFTRMEPREKSEDDNRMKKFREFAKKLYGWFQGAEDRRQLETALSTTLCLHNS